MKAEAGGLVKRSLAIAGHRTSLALEAPFWRRLEILAATRDVSLSRLVAEIDAVRGAASLSSALRVYALENAAPQTPGG